MDEPEGQQRRECRKCDLVWGLAGVIFGGLILTIGLDLVTGGALTRLFSGAKLAAVAPPGEDDNDAS